MARLSWDKVRARLSRVPFDYPLHPYTDLWPRGVLINKIYNLIPSTRVAYLHSIVVLESSTEMGFLHGNDLQRGLYWWFLFGYWGYGKKGLVLMVITDNKRY